MKAIQLHDYDGIEALHTDEIPRPDVGPDEVRIRVEAAGVNPLDWLCCRGFIPHLVDTDLPWIPGWDFSGVVDSVGAKVGEYSPGDAVVGMPRLPGGGGTFAEYLTVTPAEMTAKPSSLSMVEAAGLPMAGQTASHALFEAGSLEAGQTVLIHAAAGGVGHLAVQLAADTDATVIGTASAANAGFLRELGADHVIDYRSEEFERQVSAVDLVIDAIGGDVLERSIAAVEPGGTVVTLPEPPADELIERSAKESGVDVRFFDVIIDSPPSTLQQVVAHVKSGAVTPRLSGVNPLSDLQEALKLSADGHVRGKLVVNLTEATDD